MLCLPSYLSTISGLFAAHLTVPTSCMAGLYPCFCEWHPLYLCYIPPLVSCPNHAAPTLPIILLRHGS